MDKTKNFLLDLFFPKFCLGCQKEGSFLCEDCKHLLDILEFNYECPSKNLNGLYFAVSFKNPVIKKMIYQFKYKPYTKNLAKPLASLIIEHFIITQKNTNEFWQNSVLVPVPIFHKKLKERGYNQSEELAKELAEVLKIPVISDVLIKTKKTESQIKLSKEEREKNLANAFAIKKLQTSDVCNFSAKKIFLVDDVYTTGSTMEECAKTLRQAGAKQVFGITIAREE